MQVIPSVIHASRLGGCVVPTQPRVHSLAIVQTGLLHLVVALNQQVSIYFCRHKYLFHFLSSCLSRLEAHLLVSILVTSLSALMEIIKSSSAASRTRANIVFIRVED